MNIKQLGRTNPENWPANAGKMITAALKDPSAGLSDRLLAADLAIYETVMDDDMAEALLAILKNPKESVELRKRSAQMLAMPMSGMPDADDCDCIDCASGCTGDYDVSELVLAQAREAMRLLYFDCDTNKEIRRAALDASTALPENWHQEAIRMAYSSGDAEWKLTALSCMSAVGGFEAEILESIDSEDPGIRRAAVEAAGYQELQSAWPRIRSIIEAHPDDRELFLSAIDAGASTGGIESVETLEALLDHEDPEIVYAADEALLSIEGDTGEAGFDEDDSEYDDLGEENDDDEGDEERGD